MGWITTLSQNFVFDPLALHSDRAAEISALTNKAVPADADYLIIEDSADGNAKKNITLETLPFLKTETDPLSLHLDGSTSMTGDLLFAVDGDDDIGASGASRPNNIYAKNSVVVGDASTTISDGLIKQSDQTIAATPGADLTIRGANGLGASGGNILIEPGEPESAGLGGVVTLGLPSIPGGGYLTVHGYNSYVKMGGNSQWELTFDDDAIYHGVVKHMTFGNMLSVHSLMYLLTGADLLSLYKNNNIGSPLYYLVNSYFSGTHYLLGDGSTPQIATDTTNPLVFGVNNAEVARFDADGNLDLASGNVLEIAGVQVVGAQQAAIADVATTTTVGANTGTSGAGLSLIGDTSSSDQSAALMNDLVALQEDILDLKTQLNVALATLRTHGLIAT